MPLLAPVMSTMEFQASLLIKCCDFSWVSRRKMDSYLQLPRQFEATAILEFEPLPQGGAGIQQTNRFSAVR
jgi:hypothetical protein